MSFKNWSLFSTRLILLGWMSSMLAPSFALQIGVVDDIAVLSSPALKSLMKSNEAKISASRKALTELAQQFQKMKTEFDNNEGFMDQKTRAQKEKALHVLSAKCEAKMEALEAERNRITAQIAQRLQDACFEIAKKGNLNILFATGRGVIYADSKFDVTRDVEKALTKNNATSSVAKDTELPTVSN